MTLFAVLKIMEFDFGLDNVTINIFEHGILICW